MTAAIRADDPREVRAAMAAGWTDLPTAAKIENYNEAHERSATSVISKLEELDPSLKQYSPTPPHSKSSSFAP